MRYSRFLLLLMLALLQFSCAQTQYAQKQPPATPQAGPKPPSREPAATVKPLSPSPSVTIQSHTGQVPAQQQAEQPAPPSQASAAPPPAVLALMTEAEHNRTQGNLDTAAATLERALRIQPRNAALWHELASIRLQQHQPRLAEDLAKKSNTLAYRDHALKKKNWQLIARGRRIQGDEEGAQEAEDKTRAF